MDEQTHETTSRCRRLGRGARIGIFAAVLIGVGVLGATLIGRVGAHTGWTGHGGYGVHDIEEARERAQRVSARLAGAVEASDAQREQLDTILRDLADTLYPMAETHREQHRALVTELTRPHLEPGSLDAIRLGMLRLADDASRAVMESVVRVSEVLDPEQRQALAGLALDHHAWR